MQVTISNKELDNGRHVRNGGEGGGPGPPRGGHGGPGEEKKEEFTDEAMRTLWVGGISDKAEEEVLYELFMNAGPLDRISHPCDKETKKKKAFAFIVFEHPESIKYAYDLLNGVELYGQRLRLQHKETGLGINIGRMNPNLFQRGGPGGGEQRGGRNNEEQGGGRNHSRSFSTSSLPNQFQGGHQQQFMNGMNMYGGGVSHMNPGMNGGMPMSPMYMNGQGYDQSWGGGGGFDRGPPPPPPPRDYDRRDSRSDSDRSRRFDQHDDRNPQYDDQRGGRQDDRVGRQDDRGGRQDDRGGRDEDRYRDRSHNRDSRDVRSHRRY